MLLLVGCTPKTPIAVEKKEDLSQGVWLSFSEINRMLTSPNGFKTEFQNAMENMKDLRITDLYFHIRSHCDSIVKSKIFPKTETSQQVDFDILEYVTDTCHRENIKVHAWINPYRVNASSTDIDTLPENSPAKKWLRDENKDNDKNVCISDGIYLNPAEKEVRKTVTEGIREITDSYDIDGIHFDDYFYPTTAEDFDKASFEGYKKTAESPLSLDDWRRANVDILIADCKMLLDSYERDITFSVSPAADIDKNYNAYYADIFGWAKKGYIDALIPQLYFGFKHSDSYFNFDNLLKKWSEEAPENVTLQIGLAPYKIGTSSPTDGEEWTTDNDILSKQVSLCRENPKISGVCYFSYTYLFSSDELNTAQRENIKGLSHE